MTQLCAQPVVNWHVHTFLLGDGIVAHSVELRAMAAELDEPPTTVCPEYHLLASTLTARPKPTPPPAPAATVMSRAALADAERYWAARLDRMRKAIATLEAPECEQSILKQHQLVQDAMAPDPWRTVCYPSTVVKETHNTLYQALMAHGQRLTCQIHQADELAKEQASQPRQPRQPLRFGRRTVQQAAAPTDEQSTEAPTRDRVQELLAFLAAQDGPVSQRSIKEALHISGSVARALLEPLCQSGTVLVTGEEHRLRYRLASQDGTTV